MAGKTFALSVTSHLAKATDAVTEAIDRALEICGGKAETYAKKLCRVDTGYLRNSIAHGRTGGRISIDTYRSDNGGKQNKPISTGSYTQLIPESDKPTMIIGTNVEYAPYVELGHHTSCDKLVSGKPYLAPALENHVNEYREKIGNEQKKK